MCGDDADTSHLVDGKYSIGDLVDLDELGAVFEKFTQATGFTIGFLDHPGLNVLVATGWRDICTKFHRACPASAANCSKSNRRLLNQLNDPGDVVVEQCENGLWDCAIPIIIKGKHIASLATGQMLLEEPDMGRFRQQAEIFRFDVNEYLEALKDIPVVSEEKLRGITAFLGEMAHFISKLGYTNLIAREESLRLENEITERRRAESALRISEERFREAMEATSDGLWDWDLAANTVYYSPGYSRMLGYEPAKFPANVDAWLDLVHPDDRERTLAVNKGCIRNEVSSFGVEFRMRSSDGAWRWILGRGKAARRDAAGRAIRMIGTHVDITERKRAEESLKESETKFRSYIESAPLAIFVADLKGRLMDFNPAAINLLGYDANTLRNMSILDLHPKEDREEALLNFATLLEGGRLETERRLKRRDGQLIWVSLRAVMITDQLSFAYCQDITERKQLEEERSRVEAQLMQAQKMEALGTLAGGIAHDFNNILAVIIGYSEVAQARVDDPVQVRQNLCEVFNAVRRARDLVQQILAFSRFGGQEKRSVQVGVIVREALKMLRATLPSTIEIKQNVASKASVMADPTQIHQILMNLCTNAAHAMRGDVGTLRVSLTDVRLEPGSVPSHSKLQPGPYVKLTVRDTGHGIEPSIMDRIFDPFFTTKEQGAGTGLGLAVVHGIVKSHGGTVVVESDPGEGTAFHVVLPVTEAAAEPASAAPVSLPRGRERILIVDDEPALAMVTKEMVKCLGYEVDFRTNGVDALEVFRRRSADNPFDLVITDMTMPHMTGVKLARELLGLRPNLPILLCTGFSETMDAAKAKNLGIKGFLMKPMALRELAAMIRNVLDEKEK